VGIIRRLCGVALPLRWQRFVVTGVTTLRVMGGAAKLVKTFCWQRFVVTGVTTLRGIRRAAKLVKTFCWQRFVVTGVTTLRVMGVVRKVVKTFCGQRIVVTGVTTLRVMGVVCKVVKTFCGQRFVVTGVTTLRENGRVPGRRHERGGAKTGGFVLAVSMLVLGLLFLTTIAGPASAMTLDEAVERAVRANPGLKAARYDWRTASTEKTRVTSLPDPTLDFSFGSSGPDYEGDLRTVGIAQALPFPAKILKSRSRAESMESAAGARYETAERRVIADVKQAYVELAVIDDKIKILENDLADARFLLEAVRQRYELGRIGQHDLVKAQVEVLMVENRLHVITTDSRTAVVERLRALLALERAETLGSLEMPQVDFALVDTAAIRAAGVEGAPDLESIGYMAEAAREDVSLARMQWIPDLKLKFFVDQRDMAMGRNKAKGVMLSANLPLWAWRTRAAVDGKSASLARKHSELEAARDRLESKLESSLSAFAARFYSYALFESGVVPQAELAYMSARTAYETGEMDILSLIAARRSLREARLMQLDLLAGMAGELAEIETLTGLEFY